MSKVKKRGTARKGGRGTPTREDFDGMPMVLGVAHPRPTDRQATAITLRPELGFVEGNIAFVCHRYAVIAEAGKPSELRVVANWLDRHRATGEELRTTAGDLRRTADEFERLADGKNDTSGD